MNHPLEEIAALYVLDQLEPNERAQFEPHLARDPALAALVRDYESAFAAGIRALPPRQPAPRVLANIEEQIDAETGWSPHSVRAGRSESTRLPEQPARSAGSTIRWTTFAQWGIAAVITVSLATLAIQSLRAPSQPVFVVVGLDANRNTFAELPTAGPVAKDPDTRFIQLASTAENLWRNPEARPLSAAPASTGNHGYAVFDPGSQQGFIAIEQLPVLTGDQRYHLWVVDHETGRIRDAGILPLTDANRGLYSFALDPAAAKQSAHPNFFITVEDTAATSAPAKPSGKVVLGKNSI
jgi:anti-sigma-K factor RskA